MGTRSDQSQSVRDVYETHRYHEHVGKADGASASLLLYAMPDPGVLHCLAPIGTDSERLLYRVLC